MADAVTAPLIRALNPGDMINKLIISRFTITVSQEGTTIECHATLRPPPPNSHSKRR